MLNYIIRRLIQTLIIIFVVSFISYLFLNLIPGDPARYMLGVDAPQEQVDALRHELWLDQPLVVQYIHWLTNILHGDFGHSLVYQEKVAGLIFQRLPVTFYLAVIAFIISSILGIISGTISAVRRGGILDNILTPLANIGVAIPIFWLGILGIYFFGLKLGWLDIQGFTSPLNNFGESISKSVMPVICLSVPALAIIARQTRSSMLEIVHQDYIRTAKSKGLKERVVVLKHALKNALIPIVTLLGLQVRIFFGGTVLVETVFNIPGFGRLLTDAVFNKDFLIVQGGVLISAIVVSFANLFVDICYGWLDPRIRYE